ncbi:hypothetical protein [Citrobacter phage Tr1]|nr:hypothetical protein [Citrobacter phage Tr1]
MSDLFYTGVGSRDITDEEWDTMVAIAKWLAKWYILRSGKASGSDSAFEYGVSISEYKDNKEIYIPWPKFEGNEISGEVIPLSRPDSVNYALTLQYAKEIHPAFERLSQGAKKLHQRNVHQVLGRDLENPNPSKFLLACSDEDKHGDVKGGTRTAWMLAKKFGTPCFNIRGKTKREIFEFLKPIMEENNVTTK